MLVDITKGIKVGGLNFETRMNPETDKVLDAEIIYGDCSLPLQLIRVKSTLLPQYMGAVFLHESLHAIDKVYLNNTLTENQIDALANGLYQVMASLGVQFGKVDGGSAEFKTNIRGEWK